MGLLYFTCTRAFSLVGSSCLMTILVIVVNKRYYYIIWLNYAMIYRFFQINANDKFHLENAQPSFYIYLQLRYCTIRSFFLVSTPSINLLPFFWQLSLYLCWFFVGSISWCRRLLYLGIFFREQRQRKFHIRGI